MQCCLGITNRLNGGSAYCLFLDYDNASKGDIHNELMVLQKEWKLGYAYIIETKRDKKHYHVICPAVFTPYEILGILWDSKLCDIKYKQSFFTHKERTLRISEKKDGRRIKFPSISEVMVMDTHRTYSDSHLKFIEKYYKTYFYGPILIPSDVKLYKSDLEVVKYMTHIK